MRSHEDGVLTVPWNFPLACHSLALPGGGGRDAELLALTES